MKKITPETLEQCNQKELPVSKELKINGFDWQIILTEDEKCSKIQLINVL